MSFENLNIRKIIIHEVYARADDRALIEPTYGDDLLELPREAKDELQVRITNALGESSHGVEMAIRDSGADSALQKAKELIEMRHQDAEFVAASKDLTKMLAVAQNSRRIPGGIVVVVCGTCGNPSLRFVCVIKAEPHGGFTKRQYNGRLTLEYLKDLILTPQAKLYKIGAFLFDDALTDESNAAAGCRAFIFDDNITRSNKLAAAQYFLEGFLGLQFPTNSAFQTKQFHSLTKEFIRASHVDPEKKIDLLNALTTYLKADQTATVQIGQFADTYFDDIELHDSYTAYMQENNFPITAIHKDLSEVQSQLRFRKLTFGHDIRLTAPADHFERYVRIETVDGDEDENGQIPKWTQITVRDRLRDQE